MDEQAEEGRETGDIQLGKSFISMLDIQRTRTDIISSFEVVTNYTSL